MRRLRVGDKILRVRDEGEGRAHPLVCVHGAASSSVVWMDAVRRLSPARRIVALDLPGHGQSDAWHESSLLAYRDAVGTVCALSKIDRAVLVGHSMGALIAIEAARAWPERVAALVLVAAAERFTEADPARAQQCAWSPETSVDLVERWAQLAWTADEEVARADNRALVSFDATTRAPVAAPTLVLSGADDLIAPPDSGAALARAIPNAVHVVVPRAGHMIMIEQPEAFYAALDEFL